MYTKMYENILVTNFFPHSTRLFHLQYAAITYGERKKLIIFHKYTRQALDVCLCSISLESLKKFL